MNNPLHIVLLDMSDRAFTFTFDRGGEVSWNLAMARAFIDADRSIATIEVGEPVLQDSIHGHAYENGTASEIEDQDQTPGIAAPIIADNGETIHIMIEGFNRAARCLAAGKPFYCDVLSDADAYACVVFQSGDNLIPTGKENNK